MSSPWCFSLLTCFMLLAPLSMEFSIDDKNPKIFSTDEPDFGYKVLQYRSEQEKWIVASAPLGNNGTGKVYKCAKDACEPLHLEASSSIKSIGMSMAAKSSSPAQFTACSPGMIHECDKNAYMNGICYNFNERLNLISNITPSFQECTKRKVDLVFLFDGSESVTEKDFEQSKRFILNIMNFLKNTSVQFAAVQFSITAKTVFSFTQFKEGQAKKLLKEEKQTKSLANTYSAMNYVLGNVLTPKAGASPDATQVFVIIAAQIPTDVDSYRIAETIKSKNIIQYVITVGRSIPNIESLASDKNNVFSINDYSGLEGILKKLQIKIYNIEGTKNVLGRKFTKEMSQSGFSAAYLERTLVLGSVGSNDWRGSLLEFVNSSEKEEIRDSIMEEDSYMGYSVTVGRKNGREVYFSGAPRFNHIGQVVVFYKTKKEWQIEDRLHGQQIGSYFGGELCALDLDSNGETDFLLVGAPLYHEPQKEGKMFVYSLSTQVKLESKSNVSGLSQGRFAATISSIQDLNGDGLKDVVVGAPLENDYKGTIYIFLGERLEGIRPKFSQRIMGQTISPALRFFGLSVSGDTNQEMEGLVDLAVGAKGNVVLLKSRPVVTVTSQCDFSPSEISTDKFDCVTETKNVFPAVSLRICFNLTMTSKGVTDVGLSKMNVSYQVDLDIRRQRSRVQLSDNGSGPRKLQSFLELNQETTCVNHTVYMPGCIEDTRSAVVITFNYSQSETQQHTSSAILNIDSKRMDLIEVPFQRNCRNDTCVSDLELDFAFGTSPLVVIDQEYFNVTLNLSNNGDDSYNTSLSFHYPPGLSFSKLQVQKASRRTLTSCTGLEDIKNRTVCSVSHPVYPSQTTANILSTFRISSEYHWGETMQMTIKAHSDNGKPSNTTIMTKSLPVQFAVDLVVKALHEDSDTYLNFILNERQPKQMKHVFEVKNLGSASLPVNITFTFQTLLKNNFQLSAYQVTPSENSSKCIGTADAQAQASKDQYKIIICEINSSKGQTVQFILSGQVTILRHEEFKQSLSFQGRNLEVNFFSKVKLSYDTKRYVQITSSSVANSDPKSFHETEVTTRVELTIPPSQLFIVGVGAGGGLCLLILIIAILYKLGFFKRKRPFENQCNEVQNENEEKNGPEEKEASQLPVKESDGQVSNCNDLDDITTS
ncbi:integrin alpha-M [Scleropages formosus]|uniref:Integrin alpha-M-like n=1 Tax=Scleropages formosus TaxID=113540 RepID=A0A8C9SH82_SCLFO|nr:integrin alpha-M-like [Scleropages formosus]